MALDPRYITAIDLSPYLVDKDSGAPLASGVVSFYQDATRAVPKLVYELSGAPPNYTYTALPNPIILSNTGTFQDAAGNNIAVYYFPYDSQLPDANVQLYYITVTNSMGTEQFTREAWPNIVTNESESLTQANISNGLINPQFANVSFSPPTPLIITSPVTGTVSTVIGQGWTLNLTTLGAGSVTVTRNSIAGSSAYPGNPPYTLTVTPSANVTGLTLFQRLYHNPNIWSPQPGGTNGYIATSILLAPLSSVTMQYAPSVGVPQALLTANNVLGTYQEFTNTVQLAAASNTDNADVGYVDIIITLPIAATTTLSNVQVAGLETDLTNVVFDQIPVNQQVEEEANIPALEYKPIPSYLCGWDFPLNPAQFLGPTITAQSVGANKSFYAWDQTIVFQSANSGVSVNRGGNGELVLTAAAAVQPAIVQYLDSTKAREMLNSKMSCAIESKTSNLAGITATISLWYCTDASLPSVVAGTNNSVVATLDANGHPATLNGTWVEVPRSDLGNAQFTIKANATTNFNFNGFSGWDMKGVAATQTANFFAIVVGFGAMTLADTISVNSVSVVPGDIATRPASQSQVAVLLDCEYYYSSSFNLGVVPANALTGAAGIQLTEEILSPSGGAGVCCITIFPTGMIALPIITLFNPKNNNSQMYDFSNNGDCSGTNVSGLVSGNYLNSHYGFYATSIGPSPSSGAIVGFGWTADARLGIV